jgi:hypothetical protein
MNKHLLHSSLILSSLLPSCHPQLSSLGVDCFYDPSICYADDLQCISWTDPIYGEMMTCEDCSEGP